MKSDVTISCVHNFGTVHLHDLRSQNLQICMCDLNDGSSAMITQSDNLRPPLDTIPLLSLQACRCATSKIYGLGLAPCASSGLIFSLNYLQIHKQAILPQNLPQAIEENEEPILPSPLEMTRFEHKIAQSVLLELMCIMYVS